MVAIIEDTWNRGHYSFVISDAESITGRLGYIAETSPWSRFMILFFNFFIARALCAEHTHLVTNSQEFRDTLKVDKKGLKTAGDIAQGVGAESPAPSAVLPGKPSQHVVHMRYRRFTASNTAKKVHYSRMRFLITKSMRLKITLVYKALPSPWICMWIPMGHLISPSSSGVGYSDSCLHVAGGYILDLGFWWYIEWSLNIH